MTPLTTTARALAAYPYGRDPTGDVLETRDAFEKRILAALQAVEREVLRKVLSVIEMERDTWAARTPERKCLDCLVDTIRALLPGERAKAGEG